MRLNIALCYSKILDNYTNALISAGHDEGIEVGIAWFGCAEPVQGMTDFSEFRIENFDGLVIPGGGDIHPSFYGEPIRGSIDPDAETDRIQLAMTDAFVKAGKPILGICRGHQLLNVYFGGNLHQDIPEKKDHLRLNANTDNRHLIDAVEDSFLYELYGKTFPVNSSHHQAVNQPGKGLKIIARCQDGVIEALEHETLPVFAVQFHPERMDPERIDTVDGKTIFQRFLREIRGTLS